MAFFLVLGIDAYRVRRSIPIPAVALGCALVGHLVFGEVILIAAMGMFVAFLFVQYAIRQRKARHA